MEDQATHRVENSRKTRAWSFRSRRRAFMCILCIYYGWLPRIERQNRIPTSDSSFLSLFLSLNSFAPHSFGFAGTVVVSLHGLWSSVFSLWSQFHSTLFPFGLSYYPQLTDSNPVVVYPLLHMDYTPTVQLFCCYCYWVLPLFNPLAH